MDLALNNLQWLICHKTQPNQPTNQPTNQPFFLNLETIMVWTSAADELAVETFYFIYLFLHWGICNYLPCYRDNFSISVSVWSK